MPTSTHKATLHSDMRSPDGRAAAAIPFRTQGDAPGRLPAPTNDNPSPATRLACTQGSDLAWWASAAGLAKRRVPLRSLSIIEELLAVVLASMLPAGLLTGLLALVFRAFRGAEALCAAGGTLAALMLLAVLASHRSARR